MSVIFFSILTYIPKVIGFKIPLKRRKSSSKGKKKLGMGSSQRPIIHQSNEAANYLFHICKENILISFLHQSTCGKAGAVAR